MQYWHAAACSITREVPAAACPLVCLQPKGTLELPAPPRHPRADMLGRGSTCADVDFCTQGWLTRPLAVLAPACTKNQLAAETGLTGASRTLRAAPSRHPELVHAGYRWICPCLASFLEIL